MSSTARTDDEVGVEVATGVDEDVEVEVGAGIVEEEDVEVELDVDDVEAPAVDVVVELEVTEVDVPLVVEVDEVEVDVEAVVDVVEGAVELVVEAEMVSFPCSRWTSRSRGRVVELRCRGVSRWRPSLVCAVARRGGRSRSAAVLVVEAEPPSWSWRTTRSADAAVGRGQREPPATSLA